jgi:two-component system, chemotaxis family, CheB/CheR fusion protein
MPVIDSDSGAGNGKENIAGGQGALPVVGIGASAGGLEALEALFAAMPVDSGMAFVVLQHLSPDFESRMVELLGRRTRIPIQQVTDGVLVEPDHIYLIPPRKDMILSGGHLLLTDKDPAPGLTLPIDHFMRSLAQDAGGAAIAVILSGTGSDGSRGIKEIHESGGLVIAQDPRTARFDGMPRSAIDTGVVDLELAPAAIPDALIRYRQGALEDPSAQKRLIQAAPSTPIGQILELLRAQYGIDFAHYKPNTVMRRVERRLAMSRLDDVESYAARLSNDRAELNALYFDLLIGVTRFFRDPEAFAYIESEIIPRVVEGNHDIRMWAAGCATGEEVYSLAILLHEAMVARGRRPLAKIFATDVHPESLEVASAGLYDLEALHDVNAARRERYFAPSGDRFRIAKDLRELVVFARHNVISDAPFTRLDLVSCRNLLIYLQPAAQKKALSLFHFGLKTGGHLFLGPSETPGELSDEFESMDGRWKIYRKRRDIRLPADMRMPVATPGARGASAPGVRRPADAVMAAYDQLMTRHVPPSFLVDEHHDLLHSFGGAESMLSLRGGRTTTNLLDLVADGLRAPLAGALQQAAKQGKAVRYTGVEFDRGGEKARYQITVEPMTDAKVDTTNFIVELQEEATVASRPAVAEVDVDQASRDYVTSLEGELHYTRENLQATIEELETSNEELQATNEELVAANEELQSTNEELHSVNEELHTVNVEHQRKIDQLTELTDDMDNLLQSTDIGVLFLDQNLSVRKFTPRVAGIFNLLPQDIGRNFNHFAHNIEHPQLLAQIREVMETRSPIESEVQTGQGELMYLRVLPYRTKSEARGVVLTIVDISSLRRAEAEARRLSAIVRSARDAIAAQDVQGRIVAWNGGAEDLYGYPEADAIGMDTRLLMPEDRRQEEVALLTRLARGEDVGVIETQRVTRDGRRIELELSACPVYDEFGKLTGMATIGRDITVRKRAEEQVQRAIAQREQFLALLSHELRNPLMALSNAVRLLDEPGMADDDQASARAVVRRQVQQMARLLEDLLDSSRMRRDRIELKRQLFDLRDAVAGVLDAARPQADQAGVVLDVKVDDQPLPVEADIGRLQQLQINLINNAIAHSPPGAVVRYALEREGQQVTITVEDEGDGIAADHLSHIFEPFFQGQRRRGSGMGLGLSLAQAIALAHGGELQAHSDGEDRGARFVVHFPLASEAHERQPLAPGEARAQDGAHRLVLLVDDDEDSRELLAILLRNAGHHVIHAGTGTEGLELLLARKPRAAIVDLGLPDMSGLEIARRARAKLGPTALKLIALTGFGQQKDREAAAEAGFDHHLVKPLDFETIESVLTTDD